MRPEWASSCHLTDRPRHRSVQGEKVKQQSGGNGSTQNPNNSSLCRLCFDTAVPINLWPGTEGGALPKSSGLIFVYPSGDEHIEQVSATSVAIVCEIQWLGAYGLWSSSSGAGLEPLGSVRHRRTFKLFLEMRSRLV